jgi:hypothetical protein
MHPMTGACKMTSKADLAKDYWKISFPVRLLDALTEVQIPAELEIRQYQGALLIPIRNPDGQMIDVLRVNPDGKAYLLGEQRVNWEACV